MCVVAVGGLDPSGGSGLARDLLTATELGARALLVGTAWTVQSERGVAGFEPRAPAALAAALRGALADAPQGVTAVKVGMVATSALAEAVVAALRGFSGPVVLDPVLGASAGGALFRGEPAELLPLLRRATITTPNLAEAAALLGRPVHTLEEARDAARALVSLGAPAVLVKGGHLVGDAVDVLAGAAGERLLGLPRLPGASPRGTGCALATALAVGLARGLELEEAAARAKTWLHERIRRARPVGRARHL